MTMFGYTYGEHDGNGGYLVDVTAELISNVTGIKYDRVAGILGPGSAGKLSVFPDFEVSWYDVAEPYNDGLFTIDERHRWIVGNRVDLTDERIKNFDSAWERVTDEYGYPEQDGTDLASRILERYAGLLGLSFEFETLQGSSQGEWLDVVYVYAPGSSYDMLATYRDYWSEGAYYVSHELEDALGNVYDGGGLTGIGWDDTDEQIRDMLDYYVDWAGENNINAKSA